MPFIYDDEPIGFTPVGHPAGVEVTPDPDKKTITITDNDGAATTFKVDRGDLVKPTWGELFRAGFEQENSIAGAIRALSRDNDFGDPDPSHNPLDVIKGTEVEPFWQHFLESRNERETVAIKQRIEEELRNRRLLTESGAAGFIASAVGSLVDWPTLLPGGTIYRGARIGLQAGKSAAAVGAAAGVAATIQEAVLHSQQYARTLEESGLAVGGSIILGALLGAGVSAGLSRPLVRGREFFEMAERLEKEMRVPEKAEEDAYGLGGLRRAQAAGAQSTALPPAELQGTMGVANVISGVDPMLRTLTSPLASAREAGVQLFETVLGLTRNMDGVTTAPVGHAVETRIKMRQAALGEAIQSLDRAFAEYRFGQAVKMAGLRAAVGDLLGQGQGKLSYKEFKVEVGRAMARNDEHPIPEVARAAKEMRRYVIDPLAEAAIAVKLLDPEVVKAGRPGGGGPAPWSGAGPAPPRGSPPPQGPQGGAPAGGAAKAAAPEDAVRRQQMTELVNRAEQALGLNVDPALKRAMVEALMSGDGSVAQQLLDALRAGAAQGGTSAAVTGLTVGTPVSAVFKTLREGKTYHVEPVVTRIHLDIASRYEHAVPSGVRLGAITKVRPIAKGSGKLYHDADAVITVRGVNGVEHDIEINSRFLKNRAFFDRHTRTIVLARTGLSQQISHALRGEIYHEIVHSARFGGGVLRGRLWQRLLARAGELAILDSQYGTFLSRIGYSPRAYAGSETLRELYERLYAGTPDLAERLDQEAVAHMVELDVHGQLLPEERAPIADILDDIYSGRLVGKERPDRTPVSDNSLLFAAGPRADEPPRLTQVPQRAPGTALEPVIDPHLDDAANAKRLSEILTSELGFAKATIAEGALKNAEQAIQAYRLISEITGVPPHSIGYRAQVHIGNDKPLLGPASAWNPINGLGGLHIGYVKWLPGWMGRAKQYVRGVPYDPNKFGPFQPLSDTEAVSAGGAAIHEWAHLFDTHAGQQRPSLSHPALGGPRSLATAQLYWTRFLNPLKLATKLIPWPFSEIVRAIWDLRAWGPRKQFPWMRPGMADAWSDLISAIRDGEQSLLLERLRRFRHGENGERPAIQRAKSEGRYYSKPWELFARAFEVYVARKALDAGYSWGEVNRLISLGHFKGQQYIRPTDPNFDRIINAFDRIFSELRTDERGMPLFAAVRADEPPLAPGMVRMYHGGHAQPPGFKGKLWFTTHRPYAEGYAAKSGGQLYYVDVPETHPAVTPDWPDQGPKQGFTFSAELEPELTAQRKLLAFQIPQGGAAEAVSRIADDVSGGRAPDPEDVGAVADAYAPGWRERVQQIFEDLQKAASQAPPPPKAGDGGGSSFDPRIADEIWDDKGQSYITRVYNKERIKNRYPEFKGILVEYFAQAQRRAAAVLSRLEREAAAAPQPDPALAKNIEDLRQFTGLERGELESIVQTVIAHILGHPDGRMVFELPPSVRGPLKARTLRIRDELIEDFLERDVETIARYYTRTMAPDVEITRMFGSLDMKDAFAKIGDEADALATSAALKVLDEAGASQAVKDAVTAARSNISVALQNLAGNPDAAAELAKHRRAIEKATKSILEAKERAIRDLSAIADRLRGTYGLPADPTAVLPRVASVMRGLNYLRLMGGMTVSAIPDIARVIMVHGLTAAFQDGIVPLIRHLSGVRLAGREVKLAGTALDMVLDTRAMAMADVLDDYGRYSKFERLLHAAQSNFGLVSLMAPWNAAMKQWVGMISMTNIIRAAQRVADGTADAKTIAKLAASSIDEFHARIIAEQFARHGKIERGVYLPNTTAWEVVDPNVANALDALRGAIVRDADRIIVTPGQDKPLWMSTQLGRLVGQFKSFAFATNQRVILAGLQQRDAGVIAGIMLSVGLGAVVEALKNIGNEKTQPRNTAQWVAAAIDRAGVTGILYDVNHFAEMATRGAVGISALTGKRVSRFASRNIADAVMGPTAGLVKDMFDATGAAFDRQVSESDIRALRRVLPYQNLFYLSWLFRELERNAAAAIGAPATRTRN